MLKWYSPGALAKQLEKSSCDVSACTEAQCMVALHVVSRLLRKEQTLSRIAYGGPQCFPQLIERLNVNGAQEMVKEEKGEQPKIYSDPVAREQLMQCWMRCQVCRKRRLVDKDSLPALRDEEYRKVFPGTSQVCGSDG